MIGTGVWNWALGQYLANGPVRPTYASLCRATRGHATRLGFNSMSLQGLLKDVDLSWRSYRSGLRGQPHWKGERNRLSSIPFRQAISVDGRSVQVPSLGRVRARGFRGLPEAKVLTCRLLRRPRGWYFALVLDAEPTAIPLVSSGAVGIDLGYSTLATLSTGEKIEAPNEYRRMEARIKQVQRSRSKRRAGRLMQSVALMRRTRNHQISRDLVSRFDAIYISKDNLKSFQRRWGKSVMNAAHGELRRMLATKSRQAGRVYLEVSNKNSTRLCSECGALTGPVGLQGLKVRAWACPCGGQHDRDVNAAINTLMSGAVLAHENIREGVSEISGHR